MTKFESSSGMWQLYIPGETIGRNSAALQSNSKPVSIDERVQQLLRLLLHETPIPSSCGGTLWLGGILGCGGGGGICK